MKEYPLDWPNNWQRQKSPQLASFKMSLSDAIFSLNNEIRLLCGKAFQDDCDIVISCNIPQRERDDDDFLSEQQKKKMKQDFGAAVSFNLNGTITVLACDKWHRVSANIRAMAKTIEALRGISRWGASDMIQRAFQGFAELPPPKSCWEVLGIPPTTNHNAILNAWRSKAKTAHPDSGGSHALMSEINAAKEAALRTIEEAA